MHVSMGEMSSKSRLGRGTRPMPSVPIVATVVQRHAEDAGVLHGCRTALSKAPHLRGRLSDIPTLVNVYEKFSDVKDLRTSFLCGLPIYWRPTKVCSRSRLISKTPNIIERRCSRPTSD